MRTHEAERTITTAGSRDIVDITPEVEDALSSSGIAEGHVTVYVEPGDRSLFVNEYESGLVADIKDALERVGRADGGAIGSESIVLPAVAGSLRLGTWQRVLLMELGSGGICTVRVRVEGE